MAYASDFIWRKSLSGQLLSFKLFTFHIIFFWLTQMITIVYRISLWSYFTFLVFLARQFVTRLNLFSRCFIDVLDLKEPAGTVCHSFEAFSRGRIFLKLEMISFLPIIFKLLFRAAEFVHLLRMLSCFSSHFQNLGIRSKSISQVLTINQEIFFGQCFEQLRPLFQFLSIVFS